MKVSILIANYNNSELVDRAIRSAENQLFINHKIEIIVVDDASSDSPELWLKKHDKSEITKVIYLEENQGVAAASNIGFSHCTGDCIMRLDADDYINQFYCEVACDLLENNDFDYVYSDLMRVNKYGDKLDIIRRDLKENLLEYGAGVVLKRSVIEEFGFFDPKLRNCEDRDLFLKLDNAGVKGFHIGVPYYRYYSTPGSLTKKSNRTKIRKEINKKWNLK
jgi:glycosyltransferase involved in cell wall biosynthesis